jgi:hypothetical protein
MTALYAALRDTSNGADQTAGGDSSYEFRSDTVRLNIKDYETAVGSGIYRLPLSAFFISGNPAHLVKGKDIINLLLESDGAGTASVSAIKFVRA